MRDVTLLVRDFPFKVTAGEVNLLEKIQDYDESEAARDKSIHSYWELEVPSTYYPDSYDWEEEYDDTLTYLEGFENEELEERLSSKLQELDLSDGRYVVDGYMEAFTDAHFRKCYDEYTYYSLYKLDPIKAEDFDINIAKIISTSGDLVWKDDNVKWYEGLVPGKKKSLAESYHAVDTFDDEAYFRYNYAVTTILATDKNIDILDAVFGQMSDGIWENSRAVEKYWTGMSVMKTKSSDRIVIKYKKSLFSDPESATKYLAQKIKQVVKEYIQNTGKGAWARGCREECDYLSYDAPITISDAYQLYDQLLNRNSSKFYY